MSALVLAAFKMSIVLGVALTAAALLRRRSAALRHWVLASGVLLAAVTPLAGPLLPAWTMLPAWRTADATPGGLAGRTLQLRSTDVEASAAVHATQSANESVPIGDLLVGIWFAGAVAGVGSLLIGALRLRRLARRAAPVRRGAWHALARRIARRHGVSRPVVVLQSAHPSLLVTWGLWRPKVFLPAAARDWPAGRIKAVLHHEIAHITRADWIVLMAAALLRAVCWFNPLMWLAYRRLRDESEHACDDIVLRHIDGSDYAAHLLDIARSACQSRRSWLPAPAVVHPSTLERRIRAMLNPQCDRRPLTRRSRLAAALILSAAASAVATAALSAAPDPTPAAGSDIALRADVALLPVKPGVTASSPAPAATPAVAAAQSGRGSLSGVVLDQLGGLVPGTEVTLTSEATGGALVSVADRGGRFDFTDLRPGRYMLKAGLPGFQTIQTPVTVAADAAHARTLTLPIGSLEETITVTGERGAGTAPAPLAARTQRAGRPDTDIAAMLEALESVSRSARQADAFRPGSIGGQVKAPMKLAHVNPIYPASMQAAGVEGVVQLMARIGVDGYVVSALEAREADFNPRVHPDLVAAAIDAVRLWHFTPTLLNGLPVEVDMKVSVAFSLR